MVAAKKKTLAVEATTRMAMSTTTFDDTHTYKQLGNGNNLVNLPQL